MFDVNTALLMGILGSQWAIAQRQGVKADEIKAAMKANAVQQIITLGMVPEEMPEGILPFTRVPLKLDTARVFEELPVSGQWISVESCDGSDVACYVNQRSNPTPDPIYLDKITSVAFPFKTLYLKHTAQAGKTVVLLIGRVNLQLETDSPAMLKQRWGVPREPTWTHGTVTDNPAAGTVLVTKTVTAGKTGRLFGLYITADETSTFNVWFDAVQSLHYALAGAGNIMIVLPTPIKDSIAAGTVIDLRNVAAGGGAGNYYHAGLLYDEV